MTTVKLMRQACTNAEILTVKDGRKLYFNQFGAPNGYPVIHFHGHGSSRVEGAIFDSIGKEKEFRIISHSRPGTEQSDINNNFTFESHADDVYQLAQYLKIQKFGVSGWSGGAPFAMSSCYYLGNQYDCISFGALMGGFTPLNQETFKAMTLRDRIMIRLIQKYPGPIYRNTLQLMRYIFMKRPGLFWKYLNQSAGKDDQELFRSITDGEDIFLEMIGSTWKYDKNLVGLCQEMEMQMESDWGFNVNEVKDNIQMFIFHGKSDQFVPVDLAKDLNKKLTNCECMYWQQGHMFPIDPKYQRIMYQKFTDVI